MSYRGGMSTTLTDRVQEDRAVTAVRRQPGGHPVLDVIGWVFFGIGWLPGVIVSLVSYCWGAFRFGYRQGRMVIPVPPRPAAEPVPEPAGG